MENFMECCFTTLGAVVVVYYGVKLLLFIRMLQPKRWFPLPKSFFFSMGEWAVVTGASDGIGRQYAFALAEHGMNVVIMSRTKINLEKVAKEISESTHRMVKVVVADFTKEDIFTEIEEELKYLDIGVLVNNVGMVPNTVPRKFLEEDNLDQTITSLVNCNVKTMVKMCKIILPGMENRRKGVIVNIASGVASIPFPMYSLYTASKIFVERFSQGLHAEYKDTGVIIQAVAPFGVSTRMAGYQQTNAFMLSPQDFVKSSLQYIRAGDKTYGSICHMFLGWLLHSIPLKILHTEAIFQGLQHYVQRKQAERKSCISVIRDT
ncbi:17-beta-hydroxysteroid dehydrogenase type 3-like [Stigmatopora nigra]